MARPRTDARERILKAASELFFQQGYQSTAIDEIIEKSGVTKPTLYNYFSSKELLCVEYLRERRRNVIQALRSAIRSGKNAEERFLATIMFIRDDMIDTDYRGCGFFNLVAEIADPENPVVKESREFVNRFCEEIREATIDLTESDDRYADLDVDRVSSSYYLIACGAIMAGQEFREPWVFDRAIADTRRLLEPCD